MHDKTNDSGPSVGVVMMNALTGESFFSGMVSGMMVLCSRRSRSCDDTSFVRKALSSTDSRVIDDLSNKADVSLGKLEGVGWGGGAMLHSSGQHWSKSPKIVIIILKLLFQ
jgi:hypothetical protein